MNNILSRTLHYWFSGGPLVVPLAATCFMIWFYFLKIRADFKHLPESSFQLALSAATEANKKGENPGQAFNMIQEQIIAQLSRDFVILAAMTAAAPLLGLLGTVSGMIRTFQATGTVGDITGNIAGGISQALITTQLGLIIAIPGVFGMAMLRRYRNQALVRFATLKTKAIAQNL